jgi:hypothetical protein
MSPAFFADNYISATTGLLSVNLFKPDTAPRVSKDA